MAFDVAHRKVTERDGLQRLAREVHPKTAIVYLLLVLLSTSEGTPDKLFFTLGHHERDSAFG